METITCDMNCIFAEKQPTSDWEDYYVGIAAYCKVLAAKKYLTEVATGVIMSDLSVAPSSNKVTIEEAVKSRACIAPQLKKIAPKII